MKKKIMMTMLCAMFAVGACQPVFAESPDFEGIEEEEKQIPELDRSKMRDKALPDKGFGVETTDVVTRDAEGRIEISFDGGTMSILPSFGWTTLTQDFGTDMAGFMRYYDDPVAAAQNLVDSDIHLFMIDDMTLSSVLFIVEKDSVFGAVVPNLNSLSDVEGVVFTQVFSEKALSGTPASMISCGSNKFIKARIEGDTFLYETMVNGVCYDVIVYAQTDLVDAETVASDVELMLADFSAR